MANDYDRLFAFLAARSYIVRGLRQTIEGKWEAQLHHEHEGRMIDHICQGPTAYLALDNCASLVEWSQLNPPRERLRHGSLEELMGIVAKAPKPEQVEDFNL